MSNDDFGRRRRHFHFQIAFVYFDCIRCVKRRLKVPNSIINKIKTSLFEIGKKGKLNKNQKTFFFSFSAHATETQAEQSRERRRRAEKKKRRKKSGTIHEPTNQIKRFTCKRNLLSRIAFCCTHKTVTTKRKHFSNLLKLLLAFPAQNDERKVSVNVLYKCVQMVYMWAR